jgi:hypothetical protein
MSRALASLCGGETELDFSGQHLGQSGDIVHIANAIKDTRSLMKLDISKNGLCFVGAKVLAEALRGNQVMTEINIASNNLSNSGRDMSGITTLADIVSGIGALSKLIFGGDEYAGEWNGDGYAMITPEPATLEVGMTEAEFSNKNLGEGGAIIISAWLTNKDNALNGVLSTIIVHKSPLPIQDIKTKAELDLSGKELNHLDAIIIAALLPLNVSGQLHLAVPSIADVFLLTRES